MQFSIAALAFLAVGVSAQVSLAFRLKPVRTEDGQY